MNMLCFSSYQYQMKMKIFSGLFQICLARKGSSYASFFFSPTSRTLASKQEEKNNNTHLHCFFISIYVSGWLLFLLSKGQNANIL